MYFCFNSTDFVFYMICYEVQFVEAGDVNEFHKSVN